MNLPPTAAPARRIRILVAMSFWMEPLYAGIARKAAEYGWSLDDSLRWQRELPETSDDWDGAIVFAWKDRGLIARLREARLPIVDLEDYADHFGASKVVGDDPAVGRIAAEHLIRAGCRSLVFVHRDAGSPVLNRRMEGFTSVAASAGVPVTRIFGAETIVDAVKKATAPCGVFGGDMLAAEAERLLLESGIRIPGDVAVLGSNDTRHLCEIAPVALSSVNMDFEGKGEAAAALMRTLIAGEVSSPRRVVVPPRGVTARASTRRLADAGEADAFSRLVATLERRCGEPEGVEEMCRAAGVSLPEARRLVRERLGRTLVEELARLRVARAKTLLADDNAKVGEIAKACGFGTRQALHLAFRKFEGRSPEEFRLRR